MSVSLLFCITMPALEFDQRQCHAMRFELATSRKSDVSGCEASMVLEATEALVMLPQAIFVHFESILVGAHELMADRLDGEIEVLPKALFGLFDTLLKTDDPIIQIVQTPIGLHEVAANVIHEQPDVLLGGRCLRVVGHGAAIVAAQRFCAKRSGLPRVRSPRPSLALFSRRTSSPLL
jgi:hypothetical protein